MMRFSSTACSICVAAGLVGSMGSALSACGDDDDAQRRDATCEGASCDDASTDAAAAESGGGLDASRGDTGAAIDGTSDGAIEVDAADASSDALVGDATSDVTVDAADAGCTSAVKYVSVATLFGNDVCALDDAGAVRCWTASASPSPTPAPMTNLSSGVVQLVAGANYFCALKSSGDVLCWGDNTEKQLGDPTFSGTSRAVPTVVAGTGNAKYLAAGFGHTCAALDTKAVRCWGRNTTGVLGNGTLGTSGNSATPVNVDNVTGAVSLVASQFITCALRDDNSAACWGWTSVLPSNALTGVTEVKVGDYGGCARTTGGALSCWGEARAGTYTAQNLDEAHEVPGLTAGFQSFFVRNYGACVLMNAGSVKCWGMYFGGRTPAQGYLAKPSTPVDVAALGTNVSAIRNSFESVVAYDTGTHRFLKVGQDFANGNTESKSATSIAIDARAACGGQPITTFKFWSSKSRPIAVVDANDNVLTNTSL